MSDDRLLRLRSLVVIDGVTWSSECQECSLLRTERFVERGEEICEFTLDDYSFPEEVHYGLSLSFVKLGFSPQCFCDEDKQSCIISDLAKPYDLQLNTLPRQLFYVEYFLGSLALVLNLIIVITMATSRPLRKTSSFLAVGNIALCDTLTGVYSILIARFTVYEFIVNEDKYPGMDVFVNTYCTCMGVLFTTAQINAVLSSFLLTLERYLAIVHCMNPAIRLRRKGSLVCLLSFWIVAVAYSVLPVFRVAGLRYHGEFTCMLPFLNGDEETDTSIFGLTVAVLLVVLYIVSLVLYIPIFRFVKKAGQNAGVQRKAAIAKKMAIMVVTNLLFFILPMVFTLLFVSSVLKKLAEVFKVNTLAKAQVYFIIFSWVPVVLLTINSCLNPFLCAFRHPKFQEEFRVLIDKCRDALRRKTNEEPVQITHSLDELTVQSDTGIELRQYTTFSAN